MKQALINVVSQPWLVAACIVLSQLIALAGALA
jgi:hypothetical protein